MCRLLIAGLVMLLPWPAAAQLPSSSTQTQALASCLADSTTGRDRKDRDIGPWSVLNLC